MEKLFVYGTLRKDERNHRQMRGAEFFCQAALPAADMYHNGSFPVVIEGSGCVTGEVYEVDDECLERLDWFEGVPHLYQRVKISVDTMHGPEDCWGYVYQKSVKGMTHVSSGDWYDVEFD